MESEAKPKEVEVHAVMTKEGHVDLICPECGQDVRLKWFSKDTRKFTCIKCGVGMVIKLDKGTF
jgi:predicted RNA-binding Zn-ribbon protein involved in translation (DUF1610 family)